MIFEAYKHNGDDELLRKLGLLTSAHRRAEDGFIDLGTVTVAEGKDEEYGARKPPATVRVEVASMPAQFWRFTVERPRDATEELGGGKWRAVYEPVERFVVRTGSGGFGEFWPLAERLALHWFTVEREQ
jgi:hypothetical protein